MWMSHQHISTKAKTGPRGEPMATPSKWSSIFKITIIIGKFLKLGGFALTLPWLTDLLLMEAKFARVHYSEIAQCNNSLRKVIIHCGLIASKTPPLCNVSRFLGEQQQGVLKHTEKNPRLPLKLLASIFCTCQNSQITVPCEEKKCIAHNISRTQKCVVAHGYLLWISVAYV